MRRIHLWLMKEWIHKCHGQTYCKSMAEFGFSGSWVNWTWMAFAVYYHTDGINCPSNSLGPQYLNIVKDPTKVLESKSVSVQVPRYRAVEPQYWYLLFSVWSGNGLRPCACSGCTFHSLRYVINFLMSGSWIWEWGQASLLRQPHSVCLCFWCLSGSSWGVVNSYWCSFMYWYTGTEHCIQFLYLWRLLYPSLSCPMFLHCHCILCTMHCGAPAGAHRLPRHGGRRWSPTRGGPSHRRYAMQVYLDKDMSASHIHVLNACMLQWDFMICNTINQRHHMLVATVVCAPRMCSVLKK